jgi:hypothetical protein
LSWVLDDIKYKTSETSNLLIILHSNYQTIKLY